MERLVGLIKTHAYGYRSICPHVDFSDVGRMVNNIPQDRYNVITFYAPAEGRVALITRKM